MALTVFCRWLEQTEAKFKSGIVLELQIKKTLKKERRWKHINTSWGVQRYVFGLHNRDRKANQKLNLFCKKERWFFLHKEFSARQPDLIPNTGLIYRGGWREREGGKEETITDCCRSAPLEKYNGQIRNNFWNVEKFYRMNRCTVVTEPA
jgi:hypothetical protein